MMEAVVISATVDDPWAVLIAADNKNGSQMLIWMPDKVLPNKSAIPEFCKIDCEILV